MSSRAAGPLCHYHPPDLASCRVRLVQAEQDQVPGLVVSIPFGIIIPGALPGQANASCSSELYMSLWSLVRLPLHVEILRMYMVEQASPMLTEEIHHICSRHRDEMHLASRATFYGQCSLSLDVFYA